MQNKKPQVISRTRIIAVGDEERLKEWREQKHADLKGSAVDYQIQIAGKKTQYLVRSWPASMNDTEIAIYCVYSQGKNLHNGAFVETIQLFDELGEPCGEAKLITLDTELDKRYHIRRLMEHN